MALVKNVPTEVFLGDVFGYEDEREAEQIRLTLETMRRNR